jgi:hypothetical protein
MNAQLKYPEWQEPLKAVVLEFDTQRLRENLQKVEAVMTARSRELGDELQALNDAFITIRILRNQRLGGGAKK